MIPTVWQRVEHELRGAILALCALFLSLAYGLPYYQYRSGNNFREFLQPFIFRQFSVQAVRFIEWAGFRHETAALLLIITGSIAFLFALLYMLHTAYEIHPDRAEFAALILLALFMILFIREAMPYDIWTAFFFTLAPTCLARHRFGAYALVFLLSSINRETTILLLPVFMVYFWNRLSAHRYWLLVMTQAVTFVTVQGAIRLLFRDAPGSSLWISPVENIAEHAGNPIPTVLSLAAIGIVLWLVFQGWQYKPLFLRTAFVVLAPALAVLYIIAGQAFEFRVFAEVYPVAALLALPPSLRFGDLRPQRWIP